MNHAEARSQMADYLEAELDLTKRALLDAHLDACESCSREFGEMRATIALLRGLPDPEPAPFLVESVMRRIREGEGSLGFGGRLREWIGTLASPQIALPATALGLGLLMAAGVLDPRMLPGIGETLAPAPAVRIVMRTQEPISNRSRAAGRAPYLTVGNAPPAIARVPRISINLPAFGSSAGTRVTARVFANDTPRVVTRWPSRPIRGLALGLGEPQVRSQPVGAHASRDRVGSKQVALHGSAFVPETLAASDGSRERRRDAELDQRIEHVIRRPIAFASEFSSLSIAEQEIWLPALADRAQQVGRGDEALEALRLAGDRQAEGLAAALLVELRRAQERRQVSALGEDGEAFAR